MGFGAAIGRVGGAVKGFRTASLRPVANGAFGRQGPKPPTISVGKEGTPAVVNEAPKAAPAAPKVDMDPQAIAVRAAAATEIRTDLLSHSGQELAAMQGLALETSDSRMDKLYTGFSKTESADIPTVAQTTQGQETGTIGQTSAVKTEQEYDHSMDPKPDNNEPEIGEDAESVVREMTPDLGGRRDEAPVNQQGVSLTEESEGDTEQVSAQKEPSPKVEHWGPDNQPYLKFETNPDISAVQSGIDQRYQAKLSQNPTADTLALSGLRDQAVAEAWDGFVAKDRHTAESFWGKSPFLDAALQRAALREQQAKTGTAQAEQVAAQTPDLPKAPASGVETPAGAAKQNSGEQQRQPEWTVENGVIVPFGEARAERPSEQQGSDWINENGVMVPAGEESSGVKAKAENKIYENPAEDPVYQSALDQFVEQNPDRAAAYADKNPDIKAALERKAQRETQTTSESTGEGTVSEQTAKAETTPVEQRLQQLEQRMQELTAENAKLKEALGGLAPLLKLLVEKEMVREKPEEQEQTRSLLEKIILLLTTLAVAGVSGVKEGQSGPASNV